MDRARELVRAMKGRRSGRPAAGRRAPGPALQARVRIDSIAAGGEGVARLEDGRVLFVHRTAPGDEVDVSVVETHPRWARGRLVAIGVPSPGRREAPCPFYATCGGCTLEHLHYADQLAAKASIVADALGRIGGRQMEPPAVVPSPSEFRYRNRVSFALRRLGGGRVVAGFHELGRPDRILDLGGACLLPEESVARAWDELRAGWGSDARLLPSGETLRLTLRAGAGGEVSLLIEGGFGPGRPDTLLAAVPSLVSIWHSPRPGAAELVAGAPGIPESWGEEALELSGTAFLQVNRAAARTLEDHVLELAGEVAGLRVIDAYCGVGFHARRLARAGAQVVGIELDASAVDAANDAGIRGATFLQGKVEAMLPDALPAGVVIVNPPRAGVSPEVVDTLATTPPRSAARKPPATPSARPGASR
ncbi:MAG: TRAM domain-containing protein [Gemmatimonadetes bacterium]|nr:TRAM domain-containing protein [Gemmatimonadota bacterium]